ncbi:gliding motility-associated C-terminal domain-containing protein [Adhaeribacter sp. BT258]|uniref:Gliding motility-associated C-terminal domain-containing protein n=1 Tax=Adhaeribacter terrigena TaxID=2793070 RepID=A0ABS1C5D6_9BACT|nr:gliding motility-associated C-terminal domain-containing protein [Adhaeribacter terrigena]MBK0403760.1 gliding motility-associated C-terminal domain-containing protein [Adhaeribacter terrigena]
MRRLLFLLFLIPFSVISAYAQQCFKAYYKGQEVTVICVGEPIQFINCGSLGPNGAAEYYDLDASNGVSFQPADANSPTKRYFFNNPGTYIVTQLINDPNTPGGSTTNTNTYIVKATPPPTFTATQCGNDQVKITITDATYDTYTLKVGSNAPVAVTSGQTLSVPSPSGSYSVVLNGTHTAGFCGNASTQTLAPVAAPSIPVISKADVLNTGASGEISFTVSGLQSGYSYSLEQQNGSVFTQKSLLDPANGTAQTFTLNGINNAVSNCFRVSVFDNCGNSRNVVSPVICTEVLQASAQNKKNVISWPAYSGSTPNGGSFIYNLFRREGNSPRTSITPAGTQQTTFEDTDITCGLTYCYELEISENGTAFSSSNEVCTTAISTDIPPAARLLTSFTPENILTGTIALPAGTNLKNQQVFRSSNGSSFAAVLNSVSPEFQDASKNFREQEPCYKITYTDNCGNASPESNVSCPVILTSLQHLLTRSLDLAWSTYEGFEGTSTEYTLETLDANFNVNSSQPVTGTFSLSIPKLSETEQVLRYRIKAQSNLGEISYSNTETIVQEVKIFVPTAFSPNNDGLNDVFEVKGRFQNNFSLVILNRWGQIVFESKDPKKGWDGKMNGKEAPIGVYAYRLTAIDETGRKYEKAGTLTLVK